MTEATDEFQAQKYGAGLLDHQIPQEEARLRALESYLDPTTRSVITRLGIQPGWRCLELGGGAGSVARWLAEQCAPGEVVGTDISTTLLPRDVPNLSVRRHDVVQEDFPAASFDLVHARALLEHLPERAEVLDKMARWTAPGGWVCVETVMAVQPPADTRDAYQRCLKAVFTLSETVMRTDQQWGTALPGLLSQAGLTDIGVHCTPGLVGRNGNADAFLQLSLEQIGPALVSRHLITPEELTDCTNLLEGGDYTDLALMTLSAWGRRTHH
ncbi:MULTISPECIES: class I SAM-dependent methyltransferase [unclassified Streptomyces]|uniref:class I SAM-dependent methyltransferase n=1 Tax=Streptomyces sp. NPDC055082 TaxID=3365718 RepID=UPI0037D941CE